MYVPLSPPSDAHARVGAEPALEHGKSTSDHIPQRRAFFLPSRSQLATAPQLGVGLGLLPLRPCWNFGCLSFLGQVATES